MHEIRKLIKISLAQMLSINGFQGSMNNPLTILVDFTYHLLHKICMKYKKIYEKLNGENSQEINRIIRMGIIEDVFGKNSFEINEYIGFLSFMRKIDFNSDYISSLNIYPRNRKILKQYYGLKEIIVQNDIELEHKENVKVESVEENKDMEILNFINLCNDYEIEEEEIEEEVVPFNIWPEESQEYITKEHINNCLSLYDDIAFMNNENVINAIELLTLKKIRMHK